MTKITARPRGHEGRKDNTLIVNINRCDDITVSGNTTPLRLGDLVTVTFSGRWHNAPGYTVTDEHGAVKLFEIVEQGGKLGLMYPGRDAAGTWHEAQFTQLNLFSWEVDFKIIGRQEVSV